MSRAKDLRRRVGRVSVFKHHGSWYVYHRAGGRPVRRRVEGGEAQAEVEASLLNARLVAAGAGFPLRPGLELSGQAASLDAPLLIDIPSLRRRFLEHHEHVLGSSMATVARYRTATRYLEVFSASAAAASDGSPVDVAAFVQHLRTVEVAPNGHPNTARRRLRAKGVIYILECCRAMFRFGAEHGPLPADRPNPFTKFGLARLKVRDAKPVFVFDAEQEHAFLTKARGWAFAIHLTLAKTGLRPGELAHLLVEDLDPTGRWLHVRSKPELGWTVKAGRERRVPLPPELVHLLRGLIGTRRGGPVFLRERFDPRAGPSLMYDRRGLAAAAAARLQRGRADGGRPLTRREEAQVLRGVWRDAGALKIDRVRTSFIRITSAIGLPQATCPKSWRHTFATLLQEANVDVLVRQETLGHRPASAEQSALGMTGVYTHTTPELQRREIDRAVRLRPRSLDLCHSFARE